MLTLPAWVHFLAVFFLAIFFLASVAAPLQAQCVNLAPPGGNGCGNSTPFGIPTLTCFGSPQIGNPTFGFTANVPCASSNGTLLIGACRTTPLLITGPFGAGGFCGPTQAVCALFVDPLAMASLPGQVQVGGFVFALPIPNDPRLLGARVCAQEANLCAIPGGFCVGASQGIEITVF